MYQFSRSSLSLFLFAYPALSLRALGTERGAFAVLLIGPVLPPFDPAYFFFVFVMGKQGGGGGGGGFSRGRGAMSPRPPPPPPLRQSILLLLLCCSFIRMGGWLARVCWLVYQVTANSKKHTSRRGGRQHEHRKDRNDR